MTRTINIGIIDDQILFSEGLQIILNSIDFVEKVKLYDITVLQNRIPDFSEHDVLFIDVNMPPTSGFEIFSRIDKRRNPNLKIIFLSVSQDHENIQAAKRVKADGYIFKKVNRKQLIRHLQEILKGNKIFMEDEFKIKNTYTFNNGLKIRITKRERDFLSVLSKGQSLKEIAIEMGISESTAITYKNNLFKKFKVNSSVALVKYALELSKRFNS